MSNFWPTFQEVVDDEEVIIEASVIIEDVLETFEIPKGNVIGGTLQNVSLKRVSPISAIKASLLELMVDSPTPIEFCVDEHGQVNTYTVGGSTSLSNSEVYYTITSSGYTPSKVGVMVTGAKPKTKRIIFPWVSIIGEGLGPANASSQSSNYTIFDATHMNSNCIRKGFSSYAVITYNDPIANSGASSYANGIKDLFEVANPFQSIVGYAWHITPGWNANEEPLVKIFRQSTSVVPMLLDQKGKGLLPSDTAPNYNLGASPVSPNIGTPRKRQTIAGSTDCVSHELGDATGGVPLTVTIPLNEGLTYTKTREFIINKFMGISGVYFVGINLQQCRGVAKSSTAWTDNSKLNTVVTVSSESKAEQVYRLSESDEYITDYANIAATDAGTFQVKLQFANNCDPEDNGIFGTHVEFYVNRSSPLYEVYSGTDEIDTVDLIGKGTILPTKNNGGGVLIKQVWVNVELETPSFVIVDPTGNAAEKAKKLNVSLNAIALEELPAPIAINGEKIDLEDGFVDNDPTTTQDFTTTDIEIKMAALDSGRSLNVSLGSLDEDSTIKLSRNLYNMIQKDTGTTYAHTCSPTATPELGTKGPKGGIINSISYNYQDQSSYLINVVEGPVYYGDFAGMSSGIYDKKTETVSAVGTIIQDLGNHINFKVRLDGLGEVLAINGYPGVLGVKDRVSVTLYNNPVED